MEVCLIRAVTMITRFGGGKMVIYKNQFTGLYRMYKEGKGYACREGLSEWVESKQPEALTKSLPYYKKLPNNGGLQ